MTLTDQQTTLAIVILVVLAVVAIVVAIAAGRRQTHQMRERYGSEYDRTVRSAGSRQAAEADLRARERRRKQYDIHPLPSGLRDSYVTQWKAIQASFVDEPRSALEDANALLNQVMEARGYPVRDLSGRAEDLSVDYGPIVSDYRKASAIIAAGPDAVSTEDMRSAMLLYRSLFDALLETGRSDASTADDQTSRTPAGSRAASAT